MIKKLKWKNYKALGNLELDFTKDDGTAYNTIILAGENGAGKTTVLESLATVLDCGPNTVFEYIDYDISGTTYKAIPDSRSGNAGFYKRVDVASGNEEAVNSGRNTNYNLIDEDIKDFRHYGFAYSKARSGFKTDPVKSSTTMQIDAEKFEPDNYGSFTHIKQLLIDIDAQDSSEWMKKSNAGGLDDQKYEDFKKASKGYRFEKAFNDFFDDVRYDGIDTEDPDEKKVLFTKHGQSIAVDDLSTGEKQIVFRGAHLLRNTKSIAGGIVMIDEPELSMHPKWQKKMLDYYRGLFTSDDNATQSVQMIVATHSEYVIQSALEDRDNVLVIVLTDENGTISSRKVTAPNVLPTITSAETNYLAFGVPSKDYHIELYAYLQMKTNNHTIESCDAYIAQQQQYDRTKHEKFDGYRNHNYQTLPTYIRNAIDHPDSGRSYTEEEFKASIELLIELCR
ncbi:Predicted ATP-binding protein involved in virulence [Butyrivibrio fibrisolvens DSM 3071]|uniref:Predicted ATP-binding protein involved in virulence n=1 Tax=Butyrivibrio fibrisolvens DSM 3071 TaxID=1121131 RepID=A0A1M5Q1B2_BUTFI|nr:AAA family ATPase [Butyrivibrio fibrisolvens]SHH07914.1 Predicted ATP-binding protein involved in virulence [Butyrivibrio fibrisolvens DSM 3071]